MSESREDLVKRAIAEGVSSEDAHRFTTAKLRRLLGEKKPQEEIKQQHAEEIPLIVPGMAASPTVAAGTVRSPPSARRPLAPTQRVDEPEVIVATSVEVVENNSAYSFSVRSACRKKDGLQNLVRHIKSISEERVVVEKALSAVESVMGTLDETEIGMASDMVDEETKKMDRIDAAMRDIHEELKQIIMEKVDLVKRIEEVRPEGCSLLIAMKGKTIKLRAIARAQKRTMDAWAL